jgi:hypothetical protein
MVNSVPMRVHPDFYKVIKKLTWLHMEKTGKNIKTVPLTKDIAEEIKQNAHRFI